MLQAGASATGAIRELGEALASGPFRIALTLSVIVHVALLLGLRGGEDAPARRPPMRVHFVQEIPAPTAPPAAAGRRQPADSPARPARAVTGDATAGAAEERAMQPAAQPPAPVPEIAPAADPAPAPAEAPPTGSPVPPAHEAPASPQEASPALPGVEESEAAPEIPLEAPAAAAVPADSSPARAARAPAADLPAVGGLTGSGAANAVAVPGPASLRREAPAVAGVAATAATGVPGAGAAGHGGIVGRTDGTPAGIPGATGGATAQAPAPGPPGPTLQEIAGLRRRIDARKVYPQMAIRNGWEGRVLVEMHLDLEGRLAEVRLVASSGYAILDDATITAVRHASPFPPVARVVTVPVEYRLVQ